MVESPTKNGPKKSHANWTTIGAGIAGGVLLALQGVNLSELTQVGEQGRQRAIALEGIEKTLEGQAQILKDLDVSIKQNNTILENGAKLLESDSRSLDNQQRILELLEKNLEIRKNQP